MCWCVFRMGAKRCEPHKALCLQHERSMVPGPEAAYMGPLATDTGLLRPSNDLRERIDLAPVSMRAAAQI